MSSIVRGNPVGPALVVGWVVCECVSVPALFSHLTQLITHAHRNFTDRDAM